MLKALIRDFFKKATRNLETDIRSVHDNVKALEREMDAIKLMNGKILANSVRGMGKLADIHEAEFKVFSQWGDDGIIQYLIRQTDIPHQTFIEFGVEDYTESNTRFLLMNDNWRGMVMDGSAKNVERIKKSALYWRHDLLAVDVFVDAENINELIARPGFDPELGILHIDIDGNDYWIWKAITTVNPVIVIVEYNSVFGPEHPWTIPYDPRFYRNDAHYSNLYYGSSLLSLCDLAEEKGYSFVGCNSAGNNAYFVRKDKTTNLRVLRPEEGFVPSKFAESRNEQGRLTFLRNRERLQALKGMKVINTRTGATELI